ncbi:hypothetical protein Busp01_17520 [Trinickia caryophylli]|nr:hypothetical protein Busp01_17520 [Trinickia caryophylli]
MASSTCDTNRQAAIIGPTVWELDGPMPILNKSKTLTFMGAVSNDDCRSWLPDMVGGKRMANAALADGRQYTKA